MSISRKIVFSYLILIVLLVGTVGTSFYSMNQMQEKTDIIVQDAFPLGNASAAIMLALVNQETSIRGYVATGEERFLELYNLGDIQIKAQQKIIEAHLDGHPDIAKLMKEAKPRIEAMHAFFQAEIDLVKAGKSDEARANLSKGKAYSDSFRATYQNMNEQIVKLTNLAWNEEKAVKDQSKELQLGYSIIALLITIVLCLYLIVSISKPVKKVSLALSSVADGDLTIETIHTKNKDEIGTLVESLNKMTSDLNYMIQSVKHVSDKLTLSAEELTVSAGDSARVTEQIAKANEEMANGAEAQLESVQETVNAMNEMSDEIHTVVVTGEELVKLSGETAKRTLEGKESVDLVMEKMSDMSSTVKEAALTIQKLGTRSEEIGKIVNMITEIATQTNLLSLNAAIEAARAGEHGRGFAVVADEVRKLAEQSEESAKQISQLIATIKTETMDAVESMGKGTEAVEEGLERTKQVSVSFEEIKRTIGVVTEKVGEVTRLVDNIYGKSQIINRAIENVSGAAEMGAATTQENAAASEEQTSTVQRVASSAYDLVTLAEDLNQSLAKFRV